MRKPSRSKGISDGNLGIVGEDVPHETAPLTEKDLIASNARQVTDKELLGNLKIGK